MSSDVPSRATHASRVASPARGRRSARARLPFRGGSGSRLRRSADILLSLARGRLRATAARGHVAGLSGRHVERLLPARNRWGRRGPRRSVFRRGHRSRSEAGLEFHARGTRRARGCRPRARRPIQLGRRRAILPRSLSRTCRMNLLIVSEPGCYGVFMYVRSLVRFLHARHPGIVVDYAYSSMRGSPELASLVEEIEARGGEAVDLRVSNARRKRTSPPPEKFCPSCVVVGPAWSTHIARRPARSRVCSRCGRLPARALHTARLLRDVHARRAQGPRLQWHRERARVHWLDARDFHSRARVCPRRPACAGALAVPDFFRRRSLRFSLRIAGGKSRVPPRTRPARGQAARCHRRTRRLRKKFRGSLRGSGSGAAGRGVGIRPRGEGSAELRTGLCPRLASA